ncbi:MAG: GNAT family N-acetyltransferase [Opitutales bacterium]
MHSGAQSTPIARERRYLIFQEAAPIDSTIDFVTDLLNGGGVQFFAVENEAVVGWCDIRRIPYPAQRHTGIMGMGVVASHRRQGIGDQLLRVTGDAAFASGMKRVEMEVFASNTVAIALYEKHGFAHEGRKRHTVCLGDYFVDTCIMARLAD